MAVRLACTDHRIIEILGFRPSNRLPVSYYSVIPTTGAGGAASAFFGFPPLGAVGVGLGLVEARFLGGGITVQICQFKLVKGLILK